MLCEWIILKRDLGNKLVVGLPTSNEQLGECETGSTLLGRPTVTTFLINFDNISRRKVMYDLGGIHAKAMDMGWNETVFAFHLIEQVVY